MCSNVFFTCDATLRSLGFWVVGSVVFKVLRGERNSLIGRLIYEGRHFQSLAFGFQFIDSELMTPLHFVIFMNYNVENEVIYKICFKHLSNSNQISLVSGFHSSMQ